MPPPPTADGLAARLFLGPALRTQPDRRLVSLVRQGYETAFEEIVRRYGNPLGRYAAAIVPGHRAEDVTQDAFSKALLALRQTDAEIELRPWLFRIVRNTALNDVRDQPPPAQELGERGEPAGSALEEAVRREEIADLMRRLRALPEPQRAAIVMRELEGLSHEEIAAALGVTGSAARQAIYRARTALRDSIGLLLPLPFLKLLLGGGAGAQAGAGLGGAAAASAGGAGGGVALKTAAATLLVAGTVGTGVALEENGGDGKPASPPAQQRSADERPPTAADGSGDRALLADESVAAVRADGGDSGRASDQGSGGGSSGGDGGSGGDRSGGDRSVSTSSGPGPGPEGGSRDGDDSGSGSNSSGAGPSGSGSGDGSSGSESSGSGSGDGGDSISGFSGPGLVGDDDAILDPSGGERSGSNSGPDSSGSGDGSSGSDSSSGGSGPN